jgi:hypothetical protein
MNKIALLTRPPKPEGKPEPEPKRRPEPAAEPDRDG